MSQSPDISMTIDLSVARTQVQLIQPGVAVRQVYVAQLPSGADLRMRAGFDNGPVLLVQTGGRVFFRPCVDGIYIDNIAQPGLSAIITVATGAVGG